LRWIDDGTSLALDSEARGEHLYRLAIDQTTLTASGSLERITRDNDAINPKVSPDGQYVAFVKPARARDGSLFVVRSDGSGERKLMQLPPPTRGAFAAFDWWSPEELAYVAPGSSELTRVQLNGVAIPTKTPLNGPVESLMTGSAGTVLFARPLRTPDARPELVKRNLTDGRETTLASGLYATQRRIDPAGRRLAMFGIPWDDFLEGSLADTQSKWALWIVPLDGGGTTRVAAMRGSGIAWSPRGAHLLVGVGDTTLDLVDVATGERRRFYTLEPTRRFGPGAQATINGCDWSLVEPFIVCSVTVTAGNRSSWTGVTSEAVRRITNGAKLPTRTISSRSPRSRPRE
jgi:hypothetical protein